jgi:hypothetical protein
VRTVIGLLGLLLLAGTASAGNYYVSSVSVGSTTTPVVAIPPVTATASWVLCLRSTAAVPVLCFPYQGATPVAAPASAWELTATSCRGDTTTGPDPTMTYGWACVLETSGAAATVDALAR